MWMSFVDKQILRRLDLILEHIQHLEGRMSEVSDLVKDYASKIDAATNAIAARIQKLIDQLAAGTVSPDEVKAALQPEVDKLTALGQDPAVPPVG